MFSLLLLCFVVQLLIHIVNTAGKSTVNEIVSSPASTNESTTNTQQLWTLYNKLPTPTSKGEAAANQLRKELVRLKKELGSVSAQDEFTRWAKLRRQHDKAETEYNKAGQFKR